MRRALDDCYIRRRHDVQNSIPQRAFDGAILAFLANIWPVRCNIRSFNSIRPQSLIQIHFHSYESDRIRSFSSISGLSPWLLRETADDCVELIHALTYGLVAFKWVLKVMLPSQVLLGG